MACGVLGGLSFEFEPFRTASGPSRGDGVVVGSRLHETVVVIPREPTLHAIDATPSSQCSYAGMGKIPNYFKSAQKELLSLGGKLIDKMKSVTRSRK